MLLRAARSGSGWVTDPQGQTKSCYKVPDTVVHPPDPHYPVSRGSKILSHVCRCIDRNGNRKTRKALPMWPVYETGIVLVTHLINDTECGRSSSVFPQQAVRVKRTIRLIFPGPVISKREITEISEVTSLLPSMVGSNEVSTLAPFLLTAMVRGSLASPVAQNGKLGHGQLNQVMLLKDKELIRRMQMIPNYTSSALSILPSSPPMRGNTFTRIQLIINSWVW